MSKADSNKKGYPDADTRLNLLHLMLRSRQGDLREQNLLRQGKGWFHVGGMGHEAVAALNCHLQAEDIIAPYYRDRALVMARGLTTYDIALIFFGKRDSSSGGRQLPGHYSSRQHGIWTHPSPIGAHLLPACGMAWGFKLDGKKQVVVASTGEASTRQGDFFEAVCIARELKLPVVFVVEDNGIAISTPNRDTNPMALGVLDRSMWIEADGSRAGEVFMAGKKAIEQARSGQGPAFVWLRVERNCSHSSADDHRTYRCGDAIQQVEGCDPVVLLKQELVAEKVLSEEEFVRLEAEIKEEVRQEYLRAFKAEDPRQEETTAHLFEESKSRLTPMPAVELGEKCRLLDSINRTLHAILEHNKDSVFYGEDIADPKGGVFRLTAGLSTAAPERALNAPVAESTILGLACGLACYGKRPVFEIQFIDFISPGWNQLQNNIANIRWRSFGDWTCPAVIYAPYGAYLPGGAIWHSSSAEGLFAHLPGLSIVVPSNPEDAAGLLWTAQQSTDPVLYLIPKHLMWAEVPITRKVEAIPFGKARIVRKGNALTVVTWGNCLEVVEEALAKIDSEGRIELIDLRSIVPWDQRTVLDSVRKTGRLLVVQEDTEPCSVGQMIVTEINKSPEVWSRIQAAPRIVSRRESYIGFNPIYEYEALPDADTVAQAIREQLQKSQPVSPRIDAGSADSDLPLEAIDSAVDEPPAPASNNRIRVPVLGEGITTARILSLFKAAGESFSADEAVCEVETDKAVFPIECSDDGVLVEWLIKEGDDVSVGQEIALAAMGDEAPDAVELPRPSPSAQILEAAAIEKHRQYAAPNGDLAQTSGLSAEIIQQMQGLVPATIMAKAKWAAIRRARVEGKKRAGANAPTPSAILGWCLIQAMRNHRRFTHTLLMGKLPRATGDFDLGFAVSLPEDKLATAIVENANRLDFDTFVSSFARSVEETRAGKFKPKTRVPVLLSTMGHYDVQSAIPIVVPPSIATLFIGSAHYEPDPETGGQGVREVVRVVLTFDHRWINGAGSASFLAEVKHRLETFELP